MVTDITVLSGYLRLLVFGSASIVGDCWCLTWIVLRVQVCGISAEQIACGVCVCAC